MSSAAPAPRVIAVVGPTAAGKSDLGVALARHLGGEVVNADSMQLYRGMDIGTAKLTPDGARRRPAPPPGHLGRHRSRQRRRVPAAGPRRDRPLLAEGRRPSWSAAPGSTSAAPSTTWSSPAPTPRCAPGWRRSSRERGPGALHARLAAADPEAAARDPAQQRPPHRPRPGGDRDHRQAVHRQPARPRLRLRHRPDRRRRAAARTGRADRLPGRPDVGGGAGGRGARAGGAGLREGRTASRALGYQQVLAALAGECTEEEARAETVRATKRFARRQDSWFRRDRGCTG